MKLVYKVLMVISFLGQIFCVSLLDNPLKKYNFNIVLLLFIYIFWLVYFYIKLKKLKKKRELLVWSSL